MAISIQWEKRQETARNPSYSRKAKYENINMRKILLKNTLLETLHPAVGFNATQCSQKLCGAK